MRASATSYTVEGIAAAAIEYERNLKAPGRVIRGWCIASRA